MSDVSGDGFFFSSEGTQNFCSWIVWSIWIVYIKQMISGTIAEYPLPHDQFSLVIAFEHIKLMKEVYVFFYEMLFLVQHVH